MIITRLRGGLGNQMFQYAFGRKLADRERTKLMLDLSHYDETGSRSFSLHSFNIRYDRLIRSRTETDMRKIFGRYETLKNIFFYDEALTQKRGNLYLDGYWESYKYTSDASDTIARDFTLKTPSTKFIEYASAIPSQSISVHVRRGDYLVTHGKFLNTAPYYKDAVRMIIDRKKLSKPVITIFSDDREWCRTELSDIDGHDTQIFEDDSVSDAEELILMSLYDNNVISNSTFSWWSAFLNKNRAKIVVVPQNWFTDPAVNKRYVQDIVLPEWIVAGQSQSR